MSSKKKTHSTAEGIQKEFDTFTKRTLKNLIRNELKSYIRETRHSNRAVSLDSLEEVAAPEHTPDIEKCQVLLGDTQVSLDNEHLAEGLKKLKERHQKVLECAIFLEMTSEAIMEVMELGERSVRNYKSEALRILRRHMEGTPDA